MRRLAVVAIAAVVLSVAAMTTWKSGLAAVTAEKASAETLKQIEGEFMKGGAGPGSGGIHVVYAEDAVELPDGAPAIVGKTSMRREWDFWTTRVII